MEPKVFGYARVGSRNQLESAPPNRAERVKIAEETLQVVKQGWYTNKKGERVNLPKCKPSEFWIAGDIAKLAAKLRPNFTLFPSDTRVDFLEESVIFPIISLAGAKEDMSKVGVLNFASAHHPGGGFLSGALAQEEVLAYCSNLYPQLKGSKLYKVNSFPGFLYTDCMVFSEVTFFRNTDYTFLLSPITTNVLTAPAINLSRYAEGHRDVTEATQTMKRRMGYILDLFAEKGCETVILGAYGCGVFGNDPKMIATWWKELLEEKRYFKLAIMPVLPDRRGSRNVDAFKRVFAPNYDKEPLTLF